MLSACSKNTVVTETKAPGTTAAERIAVTTATTTETEAETTEEPEPEIPMIEVKLGEMTLKLDPAMWETVDEYIARKEEEGDPVTDDEKADMDSLGDMLYVMRGKEAFLWLDSAQYANGSDGFGTENDYARYAQALDTSASSNQSGKFNSSISERNGIPYLDSFISMGSDSNTRLLTILKDKYGYSIMLSNYSSKQESKHLYELLDNISFD